MSEEPNNVRYRKAVRRAMPNQEAIEKEFACYRQEVEASSLTRESKDARICHAEAFIRWLRGDWDPLAEVKS